MELRSSVRFVWVVILCLVLEGVIASRRETRNRKKCTLPSLRNGSVEGKARGLVVFFTCSKEYTLHGHAAAVCVNGNWSHPTPVCAHDGCTSLAPLRNGRVVSVVKDSVFRYTCNPGYVLQGPALTYCDGYGWNATEPPVCQPKPLIKNPWPCNFESPLQPLCGWMHDPTHDFSWNLRAAVMDMGPKTQPNADHTFGDITGHFMYIGPSRPWMQNDTARLISPVLDKSLARSERLPGACVSFWYFMNGADTGSMNIYVIEESQKFSDLEPKFTRNGSQGGKWLHGVVPLDNVTRNFQVVLEGVKGRGFESNVAIDDVVVTAGANCFKYEPTPPPEEELSSCFNRCSPVLNKIAAIFVDCHCFPGCSWDDSGDYECCPDYNETCHMDVLQMNTPKPVQTTILTTTTTTTTEEPTTQPAATSSRRTTAGKTTSWRFWVTSPATPAATSPNYWSTRTTQRKPTTPVATTQASFSGLATEDEWPELKVPHTIPCEITLPTTATTTTTTTATPSTTATRTTTVRTPPATSATQAQTTTTTVGTSTQQHISLPPPLTAQLLPTSTAVPTEEPTSESPPATTPTVTTSLPVMSTTTTTTVPTSQPSTGQQVPPTSTESDKVSLDSNAISVMGKYSAAIKAAKEHEKAAEGTARAHGMPFWTIVAVCVAGAILILAIISAGVPAYFRRRSKIDNRAHNNDDEEADVLFTAGPAHGGGIVRMCSFEDSSSRFGEEMDLRSAELADNAEEAMDTKPKRNKNKLKLTLCTSAPDEDGKVANKNKRKSDGVRQGVAQGGEDAENLLESHQEAEL